MLFPEGLELQPLIILLAAASYFILGAIVYAPPVLGATWMRLIKKTPDQLQKQGTMTPGIIASALSGLLLSLSLAHLHFYTGTDTTLEALEIGLWLWLSLALTTHAPNYFYEGRPPMLLLLNTSYNLLGILIISLILTL